MLADLRRPIVASLTGIAAGYLICVVAAEWLKRSFPQADLVWNAVSPLRIASWILSAAHGAPLVIRSVAGVTGQKDAGSLGGLGRLLGSRGDVAFRFSMFFVPISILLIVGLIVALRVRNGNPSSGRQLLGWIAAAAVTHGLALALLARLASFAFAYQGRFAPDLGLGASGGHVAVGLGTSPLVAFGVGAAWGGGFAAAGGMSSIRTRTSIDETTRVVMRGWLRALETVSGATAALLALGGLVALVLGRAPGVGLVALGATIFSANAVAAVLLLAHGASLALALDAGPLRGWPQLDLLHTGAASRPAPVALWIVVLLPIAAGVVAGRYCRRRTDLPPLGIAVRFGALWGLTLAVVAMLVRVRILASFSLGAIDLGGGSVGFDPLAALISGGLWGALTSYVGARTVSTQSVGRGLGRLLRETGSAAPTESAWTCRACSMPNAASDRFCVSCGRQRASGAR